MSDVFLLGAGFSKAVSDSMPLLCELSSDLRKRLDLPKALSELGNNVEFWLTYLSQPHPWLPESANLRSRALFLEFGQHIGDVLNERTRAALGCECPDWLKKLVSWWHEHHVDVITLNYDTLIERAAGLINVRGNSRLSIQNIYPVALTEARRRDAMIFGSDHVESFSLFKLHGSVNWYYSGASSYVGETIYYSGVAAWGESDDYELRSIAAASDKVPLIVPPTTEKVAYFQHETIRHAWALAGEALRKASRLVCIGYSFPFTDLSIRFFLNDARAAGPTPLTIVNKASGIEAHYKNLLGDAYPVEAQFDGEEAVKKFVEQLTKPGDG